MLLLLLLLLHRHRVCMTNSSVALVEPGSRECMCKSLSFSYDIVDMAQCVALCVLYVIYSTCACVRIASISFLSSSLYESFHPGYTAVPLPVLEDDKAVRSVAAASSVCAQQPGLWPRPKRVCFTSPTASRLSVTQYSTMKSS